MAAHLLLLTVVGCFGTVAAVERSPAVDGDVHEPQSAIAEPVAVALAVAPALAKGQGLDVRELKARLRQEIEARGHRVSEIEWPGGVTEATPQVLMELRRQGGDYALLVADAEQGGLELRMVSAAGEEAGSRTLSEDGGPLLASGVALAAGELLEGELTARILRARTEEGAQGQNPNQAADDGSQATDQDTPDNSGDATRQAAGVTEGSSKSERGASDVGERPTKPGFFGDVGVGLLWPTRVPQPVATAELQAGVAIPRRWLIAAYGAAALHPWRVQTDDGLLRALPFAVGGLAGVNVLPLRWRGQLRADAGLVALAVRFAGDPELEQAGLRRSWWGAAALVGLAGSYHWRVLGVFIRARLLVPFTAPRTTVRGQPVLNFAPPWIAAVAGIQVRLPP